MSVRRARGLAAFAHFIGPFLLGTAVAETVGKGIIHIFIIDIKMIAISMNLVIAALTGAIARNLITWLWGWVWARGVRLCAGGGEEYYCCLIHHHPCCSGDGCVEFFLICVNHPHL